MKVYIDGILETTTAKTGFITANTGDFYVGRFYNNNYHLNGLLDDVRVYNRALSAEEIMNLSRGMPNTGSGVYSLGSALKLTGNLGIYAGGIRTGNAYNITLSGSWANYGSFVSSGTTTLDGANQTISGVTLFRNLFKQITSADTLYFDFTGQQSVSGALTLKGNGGTLLKLRSTKNGSGARMFVDGNGGYQTIDNLDVKDMIATGGQTLECYTYTEGCVDSGSNIKWRFLTPVSSGIVYSDEGVTPAAGKVVSLSANGGAILDTAIANGGGGFTFSLSGATMTGGSVLSIFVSDGTMTAATVLVASGSDMTNIHIYNNRLIVRNATGGTVFGRQLARADGSNDVHLLGVYQEDAGTVKVKGDKEFYLWPDTDFTATGAVKVGSGVDLNNGVFTMGMNPLTLSGSFDAQGSSFSFGTGTTFDGTGDRTLFIASNGNSFSGVIFKAGTSTWTMSGAMRTTGPLTVESGAGLVQGASMLTVKGNMTLKRNALFTKSTNINIGPLILDQNLLLEDETFQNLGVLQIGSGAYAITLSGHLLADSVRITPAGTVFTSSGFGITVPGSLTIDGTMNAGASRISLSGSFLNNGTFNAGTSRVVLNGNNQTVAGTTTFWNFEKIHNGGATLTFRVGNTFTIGKDLTLRGATGEGRLKLYSSAPGGRWKIDPGASYSISAVTVQDSHNLGAQHINPADSVDNGNNVRWFRGNPINPPDDEDLGDEQGLGGDDEEGAAPAAGDETAIIIPIIPAEGGGEGFEPPAHGAAPAGPVMTAYETRRSRLLERLLARLGDVDRTKTMQAIEIVQKPLLPLKPRKVVSPDALPHDAAEEKGLQDIGTFLTFLTRMPLGLRGIMEQPNRYLARALETLGIADAIKEGTASAIALLFEPVRSAVRPVIVRSGIARFLAEFGAGMMAGSKEYGIAFLQELASTRMEDVMENVISRKPVRDTLTQALYATRLKVTEEKDRYIVEELRIAIKGPAGIPLAYVPATLFSTPQKTRTDRNGIATFRDVLTGDHRLEIRINDNFIIHRAVTLEAPEGLTVSPEAPVDILIPMVNVEVSEVSHGAAPEEAKILAYQSALIAGLLLALLAELLIFLFSVRFRRGHLVYSFPFFFSPKGSCRWWLGRRGEHEVAPGIAARLIREAKNERWPEEGENDGGKRGMGVPD